MDGVNSSNHIDATINVTVIRTKRKDSLWITTMNLESMYSIQELPPLLRV